MTSQKPSVTQAIAKTLAYQSIFNYIPHKIEIYRYLISSQTIDLKEISDQLKTTTQYLITDNLHRLEPNDRSWQRINKTTRLIKLLRKLPFVRLIAISGSVAALNANQTSDIDLFIILSKKHFIIWKYLTLLLFQLSGNRTNLNNNAEYNIDKYCLNYIIPDEMAYFIQSNQDLFTAMEIAHLKILVNKNQVFQRFLIMNTWINSYMSNCWEICRREWNLSQLENTTLPKTDHAFFKNKWLNDIRTKTLAKYQQILIQNNLQD